MLEKLFKNAFCRLLVGTLRIILSSRWGVGGWELVYR